jgi:antibiotic biosynthesis monooxygenase (ABM) superfamily enzyme
MDPADVRARSQPTPSSSRRVPAWLARVVMTITAWPFAFLTVLALFTFFDDELARLSLATRALVVSGVLVTLMANVVIPVLNDVVHRSLDRIVGGHE